MSWSRSSAIEISWLCGTSTTMIAGETETLASLQKSLPFLPALISRGCEPFPKNHSLLCVMIQVSPILRLLAEKSLGDPV